MVFPVSDELRGARFSFSQKKCLRFSTKTPGGAQKRRFHNEEESGCFYQSDEIGPTFSRPVARAPLKLRKSLAYSEIRSRFGPTFLLAGVLSSLNST